jgi:uracil-DNA glycosylase
MFSNISNEWRAILEDAEFSDDLRKLYEIAAETKVCPPPELWFNWARLTPLNGIRAIVIGQDPYHTEGVADGLAFSSRRKGYVPPSLRNVFRCLKTQGILPELPLNGNLQSWAEQGVLLLNTAFSVEVGNPRSHSEFWAEYFEHVLYSVLTLYADRPLENKLPILAWGADAKRAIFRVISMESRNRFNIMTHCHPSPYTGDKFLSCDHFAAVNKQFERAGQPLIDWSSVLSSPDCAESKHTDVQVIYTDGSSYLGEASYACVFTKGPLSGFTIKGKMDTRVIKGTNIRAECAAIMRALEEVDQKGEERLEIHLWTDSQFWINMIDTYMPAWDELKFQSKANPDMTVTLHKLCEKIRQKHKLCLKHIPSHGKHETRIRQPEAYKFNAMADLLASEAIKQLNRGEEVRSTLA